MSDPTGLLARPWTRLAAGHTVEASAAAIVSAIRAADDPLDEAAAIGGIVVGLPRRLSGEENDQTAYARALAAALHARTGLEVTLQDERLTSRQAESELAEHEKDWRERKRLVDAAAAAIILQDFLDARHDGRQVVEPGGAC